MVVERNIYQQPGVINLIKHLIWDVGNLSTQHIELFRHELSADIQMAAKYTSIAVVGAIVAFTSLIFLGFSLIFVLNLFLPLWIASLVVTAIYLIIAVITVILAKNHLQNLKADTTLYETRKTMEDAKKWLQELK